ncbi:unnamed protein product, partial [Schistocephalus solidus]|uniref:TORC_M domain-containing protein n=1 Tax=Schistocephalus solidus TaxID=70667 RepID=A0A183TGC4_SCHSO
LYGTPTPWDPSQVWWHAQERLRSRQPPAPSPISGLLDSVLTPGSDSINVMPSVSANFNVNPIMVYIQNHHSNTHSALSSCPLTSVFLLLNSLPP